MLLFTERHLQDKVRYLVGTISTPLPLPPAKVTSQAPLSSASQTAGAPTGIATTPQASNSSTINQGKRDSQMQVQEVGQTQLPTLSAPVTIVPGVMNNIVPVKAESTDSTLFPKTDSANVPHTPHDPIAGTSTASAPGTVQRVVKKRKTLDLQHIFDVDLKKFRENSTAAQAQSAVKEPADSSAAGSMTAVVNQMPERIEQASGQDLNQTFISKSPQTTFSYDRSQLLTESKGAATIANSHPEMGKVAFLRPSSREPDAVTAERSATFSNYPQQAEPETQQQQIAQSVDSNVEFTSKEVTIHTQSQQDQDMEMLDITNVVADSETRPTDTRPVDVSPTSSGAEVASFQAPQLGVNAAAAITSTATHTGANDLTGQGRKISAKQGQQRDTEMTGQAFDSEENTAVDQETLSAEERAVEAELIEGEAPILEGKTMEIDKKDSSLAPLSDQEVSLPSSEPLVQADSAPDFEASNDIIFNQGDLLAATTEQYTEGAKTSITYVEVGETSVLSVAGEAGRGIEDTAVEKAGQPRVGIPKVPPIVANGTTTSKSIHISLENIKVSTLLRGLSSTGKVTASLNVKPGMYAALSRWVQREAATYVIEIVYAWDCWVI
ncbi:hypothetical protein AX17_003308 [Amanita inopinata Kibby_2008]|nr:hypothetical protein AX17_003308 [Amanita inopinata Kibby_2008]